MDRRMCAKQRKRDLRKGYQHREMHVGKRGNAEKNELERVGLQRKGAQHKKKNAALSKEAS